MVTDPQLQVLATTRLGLVPRHLGVAAEQLKALMASGRPAWLEHAGRRYLAILPLDRKLQGNTGNGETLLVDLDFNPLLDRTRFEAWLYLGQTLVLLLLLGLLLNRLYHRLITRRLARIDRAARRFAADHDQRPRPATVEGHDEIGQLAGTFNRMMSQLHERQQALQNSERLMRELFDSSPVGMLVVSCGLCIEQANPAAAVLFGCAPADLPGKRPRDRLLKGESLRRLLRTPANTPVELTGLCQGRELPLEVTWTPFVRDGSRHYLLLLRDISERLQAEQRLRFLAHFDPLTHLANRHYLVQRLEQLLATRTPLSLLFLDIDHFKRINDTLGHEVGDHLLVEIARRLTRLVPDQVLVARSGGDEFLLLLARRAAEQARELAETLLRDFKTPLQVGQYECFLTPPASASPTATVRATPPICSSRRTWPSTPPRTPAATAWPSTATRSARPPSTACNWSTSCAAPWTCGSSPCTTRPRSTTRAVRRSWRPCCAGTRRPADWCCPANSSRCWKKAA
ncbi:diguanylate cyclase domain-containing protein [Azotobacter vinelandii]